MIFRYIKYNLFFDYFLAATILLLMGVFSIITEDIEIILPELGALCAGCLIYKKSSWISNPKILFAFPSFTAFLGFGINKIPITLEFKIALVLSLIFLLFYFSKNVLAPAIATGLLPIITNCHSVYFLISTVLFTFLLSTLVQFKYKTNDKIPNDVVSFRTFFAYFSIIVIWLSFCYYNNYTFMLAIPPVIVVGLEMISLAEVKIKPILIKTFLLVISALIGGFLTLYVTNLIMLLLIDFIVISLFLMVFKQKMAPAYAIVMLPILLKNENPLSFSLYVLIICCAIFGGAFLSKYVFNKFIVKSV